MPDPDDPYGNPYDEHKDQPDDDTGQPMDGPSPYELDDAAHDAPYPSPTPAPMPPVYGPPPGELRCQQCQADLTGATLGGHCPQCGAPIVASGYQSGQSSGKAVASLVLGVISIPTCLCCGLLGVVLGPLAIVFAKMAQNDIERGIASTGSAGMANAGLICGIVGTALGAVSLVLGIIGQLI